MNPQKTGGVSDVDLSIASADVGSVLSVVFSKKRIALLGRMASLYSLVMNVAKSNYD